MVDVTVATATPTPTPAPSKKIARTIHLLEPALRKTASFSPIVSCRSRPGGKDGTGRPTRFCYEERPRTRRGWPPLAGAHHVKRAPDVPLGQRRRVERRPSQ